MKKKKTFTWTETSRSAPINRWHRKECVMLDKWVLRNVQVVLRLKEFSLIWWVSTTYKPTLTTQIIMWLRWILFDFGASHVVTDQSWNPFLFVASALPSYSEIAFPPAIIWLHNADSWVTSPFFLLSFYFLRTCIYFYLLDGPIELQFIGLVATGFRKHPTTDALSEFIFTSTNATGILSTQCQLTESIYLFSNEKMGSGGLPFIWHVTSMTEVIIICTKDNTPKKKKKNPV